ncbi:MAG: hypothetical protein IB618_02305 [Candidatus Pacearchaeota archaeon]|nr:MAG: hypothetical protein IB618_02305 [Candidatus Pacearchaeota archaeon]
MVKKSVVFCIILALVFISSSFALAQESEEDKVAEAYDFLIDRVRGNWNELSIKQQAFSLLALNCNTTYTTPGLASLNSKAFITSDIKCWGAGPKPSSETGCLLTETALSKMVLDVFDENTTKVKNWLLGQNMTQTQGIDWILQIDVERGYNATCSVIYAGQDEKLVFKVNDDKTVEMLNTTDCFKRTHQNYWFEIEKTPQCYSNVYTLKCWSDAEVYRASLLYKKPGSQVWHVSSETKSGRPGVPGSTRIEDHPQPLELRMSSFCLANPYNVGTCDYEGTAWTAYVLSRQGDFENANLFIPYLVVFANENTKWFPESFLFPLTSQIRYSDTIVNAQKIVGLDKGYWLIQPIIYGRVYDTAHAGLALEGAGQDAITKAKNYLLANQETNGDLVTSAYGESGKDSIRDTAFALWVFWPYLCPGIGGPGACEELAGHFCKEICIPGEEIEIPTLTCPVGLVCCKMIGAGVECADAGGTCREECDVEEFEIYELSLTCPGWQYCCKKYEDAECSEIPGAEKCETGEECSGDEVYVKDGLCCLGSCIANVSEQFCIDIGVECEINEVCIRSLDWELLNFIATKDTTRCCTDTCVQDVTCDSIGEECGIGEECSGTFEETRDVQNCCVGICLESCSRKGGGYCLIDEDCTGTFVESSEGLRCCINGECKKPTSLWWLWLIIILIAIGGFLLYYFKLRPKKPRKKKEELFGIRPTMPPRRPVMPAARAPVGMIARPMPTATVARPIRPGMVAPKPMARARVPAAPKAKKAGGKTESDLEKTLKKLKKMTKK